MKTFKQLIAEVAQPNNEDELNFKEKHSIEVTDHPVSKEHQHSAEKKSPKRRADYDAGEDDEVYEAKVDPVGQEDDDIDNDGDVDDSDEYLHTRRKAIAKAMKKESKLDPVGKEDDDIDNDGDVDSSDEYLHTRRKAIAKAMKKESLEEAEAMPAIGRKLQKMATKEKNDRIANAMANLGDHLESFGSPFGAKNLKDLAKKSGLTTEIIQMLIKKAQATNEAADSPYAIGMASAMKSTGDTPPLKKSTITKAHKIAKSIEKNESVELEEKLAWSHKTYDDYVAHNKAKGLQVIPKDLWHNLKKNPNQPSMKKEETEHLDEVVQVDKKNYSWGKMITVRHGSSHSFPLHPEHQEKIGKLNDGESTAFKDETGSRVTATRQGDKVHLKQSGVNKKTTVAHSHFTESVEQIDEANEKKIIAGLNAGDSIDVIVQNNLNRRGDNKDEILKVIRDYNWKKRMKKESTEQIDEVSKKTLKSYMDAARKDMRNRYYDDSPESDKKFSNRSKGIEKALDKRDANSKAKVSATESFELTENFKSGATKLNDGSSVIIKDQDAKLLNKMFADLNADNKKRMMKVAMTDKGGFNEILGFAREAL
jgi:hypothetical protein